MTANSMATEQDITMIVFVHGHELAFSRLSEAPSPSRRRPRSDEELSVSSLLGDLPNKGKWLFRYSRLTDIDVYVRLLQIGGGPHIPLVGSQVIVPWPMRSNCGSHS